MHVCVCMWGLQNVPFLALPLYFQKFPRGSFIKLFLVAKPFKALNLYLLQDQIKKNDNVKNREREEYHTLMALKNQFVFNWGPPLSVALTARIGCSIPVNILAKTTSTINTLSM